MNRPGAPMTSAAASKGTDLKRAGTDDAALTELRNAAATYDFLRLKGDPVQFWEALRLARNRRSIATSADGAPVPPSAGAEADLRKELDSIRRQLSAMVGSLRRFLKQVPGLPEPADRLELALAFLLASSREHQAVAKWADPALHGGKAAEKLKSLAAITDPYREALKPWVLEASAVVEPAPAPVCDVALLRRALSTCEIFDGLGLGAALWEAIFLLLLEGPSVGPALDRLVAEAESGELEGVQEGAEKLYGRVTAMRKRFGKGVESLGQFMSSVKLLPEDECAFDVALGLLLSAPGTGMKLTGWLAASAGGRETWAADLKPLLPKAEALLRELDQSGR